MPSSRKASCSGNCSGRSSHHAMSCSISARSCSGEWKVQQNCVEGVTDGQIVALVALPPKPIKRKIPLPLHGFSCGVCRLGSGRDAGDLVPCGAALLQDHPVLHGSQSVASRAGVLPDRPERIQKVSTSVKKV